MAKRFSKKYGNKGCAINPKVMSSGLSTPDATSLHHCLKNKQLKQYDFSGKDPSI